MNTTDTPERRALKPLLVCAIAFFLVSIGSLAALCFVIVDEMLSGRQNNSSSVQQVLFISFFSAIVGFILIRAARNVEVSSSSDALPADVKELLGPVIEKSDDPIGDWTRLVGLTGGTGVFRKLELSGMPLATILMTILFCILGLIAPILPSIPGFNAFSETAKTSFGEAAKIFLDMAKLTLGAFIGSFVTKGTSRDADATRAGAIAAATAVAKKLPVRVPTPAPAMGPSPPPAPAEPVN